MHLQPFTTALFHPMLVLLLHKVTDVEFRNVTGCLMVEKELIHHKGLNLTQ